MKRTDTVDPLHLTNFVMVDRLSMLVMVFRRVAWITIQVKDDCNQNS